MQFLIKKLNAHDSSDFMFFCLIKNTSGMFFFVMLIITQHERIFRLHKLVLLFRDKVDKLVNFSLVAGVLTVGVSTFDRVAL